MSEYEWENNSQNKFVGLNITYNKILQQLITLNKKYNDENKNNTQTNVRFLGER